MHNIVNNLILINKELSAINSNTKVIAVSKTFPIEHIKPVIDYGHIHFGENKVQEAVEKWSEIKIKNEKIKLHMIGNLQTNKVKYAVKIFDYIHSVDTEKLAKKIAEEQIKINKKIKIFIQVNIGNENQKSGVKKEKLESLVNYCKKLNLEVIGLMCIPPINEQPAFYFKKMIELNKDFSFSELSMGMSSDYITAIEHSATYIRVGSSIFGERI